METQQSDVWEGLEELREDLFKFLIRRCRDESEVEDMIQETFLRAARYRRSLSRQGSFKSWVIRIAANVFHDHVRRECRLPRTEGTEDTWSELDAHVPARLGGQIEGQAEYQVAGRLVEKEDVVEHLERILEQLQPEDRDVLGSFYSGEGRCTATAQECGIPVRLVKVRLFRARQRLLKCVKRLVARGEIPSRSRARLPCLTTRALSLLVLLLVIAVPASGARQEPRPPAARESEEVTTAAELLEEARRMKHQLRAKRGAERREALARAVTAYRRVRIDHPDAVTLGVEAAFRAGELLRASGDGEKAQLEFLHAREFGRGTPFRARAGLELGHLERRSGHDQGALEAYERVFTDADASSDHRDQASLWMGRVFLRIERFDDAMRVWRRVAEHATDPLNRVRAYDAMSLYEVQKGDLEAAAGTIEACRRSLEAVSLEETTLGERVRNALLRMRSVDEIRRVLASREVSRRAEKERRVRTSRKKNRDK